MSGGYGLGSSAEPGRNPQKRPAIRGIYLIVGAILAIAATATLIVTDNPRLLKTAVIVAVWACVFALLAGSRPRREGELSSSREEELRRTYELEIDREVAARREYELRLEVALRRELENHLKKDLGDLRAQVGALRKEIAERWNGELRLERFALRAESTRLTGSDRQVLEQQAGRLGLEPSNGSSRTEISYDLEQGTSTLPANGRPAESPSPLGNARSIEAPSNGRTFEVTSNGRTFDATTSGRLFDSPASGRAADAPTHGRAADARTNGRTADVPTNGRTADVPTNGRTADTPANGRPSAKSTPEQPKPAAEPAEQSTASRPDPLFGPLPSGVSDLDWPPANGAYNGNTTNGSSHDEPEVTISARRHRRRAEETGDLPAVRNQPANGSPGPARDDVPARPSYPDTPFRLRMPAEAAGRHGRDAEEEQPRRRRRYRDEDEENDVLARIRQQG